MAVRARLLGERNKIDGPVQRASPPQTHSRALASDASAVRAFATMIHLWMFGHRTARSTGGIKGNRIHALQNEAQSMIHLWATYGASASETSDGNGASSASQATRTSSAAWAYPSYSWSAHMRVATVASSAASGRSTVLASDAVR
jgi:hypothetical protein